MSPKYVSDCTLSMYSSCNILFMWKEVPTDDIEFSFMLNVLKVTATAYPARLTFYMQFDDWLKKYLIGHRKLTPFHIITTRIIKPNPILQYYYSVILVGIIAVICYRNWTLAQLWQSFTQSFVEMNRLHHRIKHFPSLFLFLFICHSFFIHFTHSVRLYPSFTLAGDIYFLSRINQSS